MLLDLPLADASLQMDPGWLPASRADALMAELREGIDWEVHRIRMFGRMVDSPRLSSWIGDPGAGYVYSGTRFEPRPWHPALLQLRRELQSLLGIEFNSVLANRYREGRDAMGWHSDDERELGACPVIASISLGATRRFAFKHRRDPGRKLAIDLPHGSLLVMRGDTQANYRHALPRTARAVPDRINLTFRRIHAGSPGSGLA
ncbi:MAG: DNA methylase [Gammaproteobacteria bacterium RIFCSPHIGHO2_12_FULL_63_22]|nr:MAG: DNA methylase [Gammaproteobacteria bacterium RIFCSPHIGHO2_12_FULL_63_22]